MDPSSEQQEATTEAVVRPRRSFAPVIALTLIVGGLIVLWAGAAGALMASSSDPAERATKRLTEAARDIDRAADMLDRAATVAQLRAAGTEVGEMQLGLLEGQRRLASLDDEKVSEVALRANRDMVRILEGWAQLAALDDKDLAAWPRVTAEKVLKATNRLRDGNASKARDLAESGETPVKIDHARAREVTLKVARFLAKADRKRDRV